MFYAVMHPLKHFKINIQPDELGKTKFHYQLEIK